VRPDGARFTLSYKTSTDRQGIEMADSSRRTWRGGIRVERRSFEWGTFYGDIKAGNFQLYSLRWVGSPTRQPALHLPQRERAPSGRTRTLRERRGGPAPRREPAGARPAARKRLLGAAQRIIAEDCVYASLWYPDDIYALADRFEGFEPTRAASTPR